MAACRGKRVQTGQLDLTRRNDFLLPILSNAQNDS
jgi:hypothetical protein